MVLDQMNTDIDVDRRTILQTVGAGGMLSIAGCFSDSDDPGEEADVSFPLELNLEVNADNDDRVQMVELIAESFEQTGYFETNIETFEWNTYVERVMGDDYPDMGVLPTIGLSGTFNPGSFCNALHHTDNIGQCCNLTGVGNDDLDDMIDRARYGLEVSQDVELRGEQYDEVWVELAEQAYSSITHFDTVAGVTTTDVHNFAAFPFSESVVSYAIWAPTDEQVMWIDRDNPASPDSRSDLSELSEGGELRVGAAENPDSFDEAYSTDTTSSMAQSVIFESLITSDEQGGVYPWLAESYEIVDVQDVDRTDYEDYMISVDTLEEGAIDTEEQVIMMHPEDDPFGDDEVRILTPEEAGEAANDGTFGMQFRFFLEEGVQFHNGQEMTASDVVASLQRRYNSMLEAQTFDSTLHIEEVDEYTVDIFAQIPDAEAERNLPGFAIMPEEQAELPGGEVDPRTGEDPIGTGPYTYAEMDEGNSWTVERFDGYWATERGIDSKEWFDGPAEFPDGPVFDSIFFEIIADNSTRQASLQNEEIDLTYGLNTAMLDDFVASDDFIVDYVQTGGYEYMQYPVNVEPFDDPRLRQALNHLVPRQQIVDNVLNGWGEPAWTSVPNLARAAGTADYDALEDEVRPYNEFDAEQAIALIEQVIEDHGYASDV